ncbi:bifunctional hydroxymethylpyrimidine kinase/phosphomethylpyrimidine kinase [Agreia sp. PsM10]|uniref:bifunctional hydroxymethylpyrimidine kinase/phosphomethylpyrimidine kinase n=1 Tax=Agreia sp. PsM10 TaxID=3030533 RepID=UPI00263B3C3A|nr:bifunctional hydroxymethylpyrimidine kinase/phosphomethylpyrimidine kinase [Agreia sp. PsM10]MDN4640854.1 bifunctional hydroxymethylpyrimidine kinase/phosphomethylpyrimidine kinase [Agreia sp. PsM10]
MSEAANAQAVRAVPRVLSIAGTDPTGGAGIQADLKSIAANGGYGMAVVTALVTQNTGGVRSVHVPPVTFLREQLDAVSDDVEIDAVKIGMLADIDVIGAVREWLVRVAPPIVVLDPVMVATSGDRLLRADSEGALRDLARLAHLVTPNIPELAILADEPPATSWEETVAQAARVSKRLGVMVLAKGGHLDHGTSPDALVDARGGEVLTILFDAPRIATTNTHGTGCSLSSALATRLVTSPDAAHAVGEAKRWLSESIRGGADLEVGRGNGPISHFAGMWQRAGLDTRPTAGEIRAEWWEGIRPVRERIDTLPFVVGLGDGTLDDQTFRGYLAQDALYLRDFARALATASALAPTLTEQAFWAAAAEGSITAELELHDSWLADGALAGTRADHATTAYLNHLLARCTDGSYTTLIAALLPCFWLYQDLGERLLAVSHEAHPYRSWIEAYADEAVATTTEAAVAFVMDAAARADDAGRSAMRDAFVRSAEHELAFFAAPFDRMD